MVVGGSNRCRGASQRAVASRWGRPVVGRPQPPRSKNPVVVLDLVVTVREREERTASKMDPIF